VPIWHLNALGPQINADFLRIDPQRIRVNLWLKPIIEACRWWEPARENIQDTSILSANNSLSNTSTCASTMPLRFNSPQRVKAREIGDRRGEGHALWNMSLALEGLGERGQAIQYAEQALIIREQIEDPNAAQVRTQLATWREQTST